MSTFKNKNSLRTIEAQIVQKLKNNEARSKFTGSYKKKACMSLQRLQRELVCWGAFINTSESCSKHPLKGVYPANDTVWSDLSATKGDDSTCPERLQRRAARIIMRSQDNDFSMKKLKWQPLTERREELYL